MTQRPRDAAGRPLPHGAVGVPAVQIDAHATPAATVAQADDLIADGRPFFAHEVLEEAWKARPEHERGLWRGLAQIAVGLTHLQRGNAEGGSRLLRRGVGELHCVGPPGAEVAQAAGVDLAELMAAARHLADAPRWPCGLRLRADGANNTVERGSGGQ